MKKRILTLLLAAILLSMAGCGNAGTTETTAETTGSVDAVESPGSRSKADKSVVLNNNGSFVFRRKNGSYVGAKGSYKERNNNDNDKERTC